MLYSLTRLLELLSDLVVRESVLQGHLGLLVVVFAVSERERKRKICIPQFHYHCLYLHIISRRSRGSRRSGWSGRSRGSIGSVGAVRSESSVAPVTAVSSLAAVGSLVVVVLAIGSETVEIKGIPLAHYSLDP